MLIFWPMSVTSCWNLSSAHDLACSYASREAAGVSVRGLREPDPRPVHPSGLARPGMARRLSEMCRVQPVPGRVLHMLCPGWKDLL